MHKSKIPCRVLKKSGFLYSGFNLFIIAFLFSSCTSIRNTTYFETLKDQDKLLSSTAPKAAALKILKNDQLQLTISSLNKEEDAIYNSSSGLSSSAGTATTAVGSSSGGYIVDADGNIQLHRLGLIHVEGMTRAALKDTLQKALSPFLKDPIVTVNFLNHKIILLGEVGKTQVLSMPEEQMSILEMLGNSGDLSSYARKDNILIIRDTGSGKEFKHINLQDLSIFKSQWYWLRSGDVVYVEPNNQKLNEPKRIRLQQTINYALTALSVGIIVLDRIIK